MAMSKITAFRDPLLIYGAEKTILIERMLSLILNNLFWLMQEKPEGGVMPSVKVNQKAPDIELTDYKGNRFSLKDYSKKKWLLIVLNRGFS